MFIFKTIIVLFLLCSNNLFHSVSCTCTQCEELILSKLEKINAEKCPKVCPDKWIPFKGSCYLFPHQTANFFDAQELCEEFGGHLVHVGNVTENAFLKAHLKEQNAAVSWMGLTDIVTENVYVWYGTNEETTLTDWGPGDPNNANNEDCIAFFTNFGYKWVDISCESQLRPVCEI